MPTLNWRVWKSLDLDHRIAIAELASIKASQMEDRRDGNKNADDMPASIQASQMEDRGAGNKNAEDMPNFQSVPVLSMKASQAKLQAKPSQASNGEARQAANSEAAFCCAGIKYLLESPDQSLASKLQ